MAQDEQYYDLIRVFKKNQDKPMKIFFKMYKGSYKDLFLALVVFCIKHSPVWVIPIVTANIITIITEPATHNFNEVWINVIIGAVFVIQNLFTNVIYARFFSNATRNVEAVIRGALVRKLQQLSISYHKDMQMGKIQSKVLRDVESVVTFANQLFAGVIPIILNTAVALTVTITRSLVVTAFFLLTIPVSVILVALFRKPMRLKNANYRHDVERMSTKLTDMVEMIPITRAHALENVEIDKSDEQLDNVKKRGWELDLLNAKFGAASWVTMQMFQLLCLLFTCWMAFRGDIDVGDVYLFQQYFSNIMNQMLSLVNIYPILTKGLESIDSIGEILWAKDVEDYSGKRTLDKLEGNFKFENVDFAYADSPHHVLNKFNFEIKAGQCVAFVGESGAGKSTIINMIIGFCRPTGGKLYIDGIDSEEINMKSFREHIAVVSQSAILFSGTVRDNITYGLTHYTDEELWKAIDGANLRDVIENLPNGVDTMIGEHGDKLSGGQRQRITIARALIRNPKVIILDEATSALDNTSEKLVQSAIRNAAEGRTMLVVAHRLSTIKDADVIAFIKDGVCTEMGTFEELVDKKGDFYNMQK